MILTSSHPNLEQLQTEICSYQNSQERLEKAMGFFKGKSILLGMTTVTGLAALAYYHFSSGPLLSFQTALYGTSLVATLGIIKLTIPKMLMKWKTNKENRANYKVFFEYFCQKNLINNSSSIFDRMSKKQRKELIRYASKQFKEKSALSENKNGFVALLTQNPESVLENLLYMEPVLFKHFFKEGMTKNNIDFYMNTLSGFVNCCNAIRRKDYGTENKTYLTLNEFYQKLEKEFGLAASETSRSWNDGLATQEIINLKENLGFIREQVEKLNEGMKIALRITSTNRITYSYEECCKNLLKEINMVEINRNANPLNIFDR